MSEIHLANLIWDVNANHGPLSTHRRVVDYENGVYGTGPRQYGQLMTEASARMVRIPDQLAITFVLINITTQLTPMTMLNTVFGGYISIAAISILTTLFALVYLASTAMPRVTNHALFRDSSITYVARRDGKYIYWFAGWILITVFMIKFREIIAIQTFGVATNITLMVVVVIGLISVFSGVKKYC